MAGWLKLALVLVAAAVVLAAVSIGVTHFANAPRTPEDLLSRDDFRCLAVSESFRTVAANRIKRKSRQVARIERLVAIENLEPLDEAKLRAELAILSWEVEDSRFMRDCAETYYEPGSTQLRKTFGDAPPLPDFHHAQRVLTETATRVSPRMLPHGYENRANLYLAIAAGSDQPDKAIERARRYLDTSPQGLYSDSLRLLIADIELRQGEVDDALAHYREVGRLKIGLDAHYARYREGAILRANGDAKTAEETLDDVRKWADRGDRQALERYLQGREPIPPRPR